MAELLYCNIYYHTQLGTLGTHYTEVTREVSEHCVYVQDAGCVQEAQRLLRESPERVYLLQEGRRIARSEGLSVPPTLYVQGNIITNAVRAKRIVPGQTYWHSEMGIVDIAGEWQVLMLSRLWIDPGFQRSYDYLEGQSWEDLGRTGKGAEGEGGRIVREHSRCVASCAIAQVMRRINQDWLAHHPPRYRDQPYNLQLVISYSDLHEGHVGTVYQTSNFLFDDLVVADKQSRHSNEKKEAHTLARYAYWLRRVYDPLQGKWVNYRLPQERIMKPHVKPKERMRQIL